jgi:hypothetical protein
VSEQQFQRDEVVTVTIQARVYEQDGNDLIIRYHSIEQAVPLSPPHPDTPSAVTVERKSPAEWPPQPGDVWHDRHESKWFAVLDRNAPGRVVMVVATPTAAPGSPYPPDQVLDKVGPLSLAWRESEVEADTTGGAR